MLLGALGCLGLMLIAVLETFSQLPQSLLWLLPRFQDLFWLQNAIGSFFYEIRFFYQREGMEALFQICLVCALAGRFQYAGQEAIKENLPFAKVLQDVEPTITTGIEEETVLDRTPIAEDTPISIPQKSQYRMIKEFGRIKTQIISPLEDSTVVPEISSLAQEESQVIEVKIVEEEKTQDIVSEEQDWQIEVGSSQDADSLENLSCASSGQPQEELEEEEYQPIEIIKNEEEEEPLEYKPELEAEEEYQPIQISKGYAEGEEEPLEYVSDSLPEEEYQPILEPKEEKAPAKEKDLEDYEEELIAEEAIPVPKVTRTHSKKNPEDDIVTEKITPTLKNGKAQAVSAKPKEYLEEDEEAEPRGKKISETQGKKTKKKSKKQEDENENEGEQRPLLGYMIPNEDLPKKIKRYKPE